MIHSIRNAAAGTDDHLKELIGKGSIAFAYRIFGGVLMFLLHIVLARNLGAVEFGLYSICFALLMLLSSFSRFVLDLGIVRKIASAIATGQPEKAKACLYKSLYIVSLFGSVVAVLLFVMSGFISSLVYDEPQLVRPMRAFALVIPATAFMYITAESLKGLKDIAHSAIVQHIVVPLLVLLAVSASLVRFDAASIGYVYLFATLISSVYGFHKCSKRIQYAHPISLSMHDVLRFGRPFFLANLGS
ncbi:MAG TPA: oligosaccharide flippase family protein, partial [Bellilinea sp.]|nr:oligosaccharide flippase family protein [Bellilinea sp.]